MPRKGPQKHLAESGEGKHRVWADLIHAGDDLILYLGGGERPHIGSLSLASDGTSPISLSIPSHKDFVITNEAAQRISRATGKTCLVVAGIHVERATKADIQLLVKNAEKCVSSILEQL